MSEEIVKGINFITADGSTIFFPAALFSKAGSERVGAKVEEDQAPKGVLVNPPAKESKLPKSDEDKVLQVLSQTRHNTDFVQPPLESLHPKTKESKFTPLSPFHPDSFSDEDPVITIPVQKLKNTKMLTRLLEFYTKKAEVDLPDLPILPKPLKLDETIESILTLKGETFDNWLAEKSKEFPTRDLKPYAKFYYEFSKDWTASDLVDALLFADLVGLKDIVMLGIYYGVKKVQNRPMEEIRAFLEIKGEFTKEDQKKAEEIIDMIHGSREKKQKMSEGAGAV